MMKNIVPVVFSIGLFTMIVTEIIVLHSFWTALAILFINIKSQ